jgi:hypothetical protein
MSRFSLLSIFLLTLTLSSQDTFGFEHFDESDDWNTSHSEYASVTYPKGYDALASRSLQIIDHVLPQLSAFFDWTPEEVIQIVLSNQTDQANGYATPIPYNRSVLFAALPTGVSELQDYGEWFDLLILHEMTHIVHLDKARDWSYAPRYVFGRNVFTFSNLFQPNFFKEGLATYTETSWLNDTGRGQSAFYSMMMRTEVASGLLPLGKVQQSTRDWPLNKAYSYGVPFYQFLDDRYGRDTINSYVHTTSGQLIPFVVDRPARHNTQARGLEELWMDYLLWLQERYQQQITQLKDSATNYTKLTSTGYFNNSPKVDPKGNVYYVAFNPFGPTFINRIGSEEEQQVVRVRSDARIVEIDEESIWYIQSSPCTHSIESSELYRYVFTTQSNEKVSSCAHYIEGAIHRNKFVLVKAKDARMQLVSLDENSGIETLLFEAPGYENIGSLVSLNSNTLALTYKSTDAKWSVKILELGNANDGRNQLRTLLSSSNENYFSISKGPTDNTLIISSDRHDLVDLWEYDLKNKTLRPLTRSLGGASNGQYNPSNQHIVYRSYSENGWDIATAPYVAGQLSNDKEHAPLSLQQPGQGFELDPEVESQKVYETEEYSAFDSVWPTSWFFGYTSDNAQNTLNVILTGRDALNFHNWALVTGRDFENDLNLLQASYTLYNHVTALYSKDYDYSLGTGATPPPFTDKTVALQSNENYAVLAHTTLPYDFSRLRIVGGFNQEERKYEYFIGQALNNTQTTNTVGVALNYNDTSMALYGISPSHGRTLSLNLERDQLELEVPALFDGKSYGNVWTFEWNEYISLYQAHTLVLRTVQGYAEKGADIFDLGDSPSFDPFEQVILHRREYPLRAYPDRARELLGYKPEVYSAEYRFPIAYVDQGLSSWPIGLHTASGTLFYETASPTRGSSMFDAAGVELNIGLDIGYSLLPVALRFGAAFPFDATSTAPDKDPNYYFGVGYSL